MAITHPYLYGTALDRIKDLSDRPKQLVVDDLLDIGDDIKEGVNSVDSARHLLTLSRQKIDDIQLSRNLK